MVFAGISAGSKSSDERKFAFFFSSPSTKITSSLSGLITAVYTWVNLSEGTVGGNLRWCSTYSPLLGFLCFRMKWTLFVAPHLSGPNMIE
ncbi:hypothetical protein HanRHA438_Chr05g0236331 [Helianthus annuus]|nr:hypothetical protein HanRHA438_Chr05g0236331 [Helianthus annuus]